MIYLIIALTVSILINLIQSVLVFKTPKKKKKELTKDAHELLSDLLSGPALVKIEYVNREDILLRSPRDY